MNRFPDIYWQQTVSLGNAYHEDTGPHNIEPEKMQSHAVLHFLLSQPSALLCCSCPVAVGQTQPACGNRGACGLFPFSTDNCANCLDLHFF